MSWRTVIISSRCKLDLKMGYLVVRGEDVKRIYLDEIGLLMIENPAVALSVPKNADSERIPDDAGIRIL